MVLLRHGRTADNAAGRIQGQLNTPLDDVGRAQARAVAPLLAAARPAVVVSSDLSRARDTATPLAEAAGVLLGCDPRLRELDLGRWVGLTSDQAAQRYPQEHTAWRNGVDVARGGGETYQQAGTRAVAAVHEALPEVPAGGVLVAVTHGGTARGMLCVLLELAAPQWWRFAALGNACWTVLVEDPRGWRLEALGVGPGALADPASWARPPREAGL